MNRIKKPSIIPPALLHTGILEALGVAYSNEFIHHTHLFIFTDKCGAHAVTPPRASSKTVVVVDPMDPRCDLAEAAATGMVQLSADQVWLGKRDRPGSSPAHPLPALGRREKRVTTQLAVSVWEEDDIREEGHVDPSSSTAVAVLGETNGPAEQLSGQLKNMVVDMYEGELKLMLRDLAGNR